MNDCRYDRIKILFMAPDTLTLWGIPYEMRPGQQPGDLFRARRDHVPPEPGYYGSKRVDLSDWIYLGEPGWFGSTKGLAETKAFLANIPMEAKPQGPFEWTRLDDQIAEALSVRVVRCRGLSVPNHPIVPTQHDPPEPVPEP